MSWLFSRALVGEFLEESSLDGEPSAPLNGNPTPQAYCAPDKMTAFSRLSRFGMTFKPLTADRGQELLTLYLAASPAKTYQPQERATALTESAADSGWRWPGSFAKYDPGTSSWRTHQCSLLGDLDEFSETWPQWGLMRDGECWEQQMSAHRISATGFGLWPTPTASSNGPGKNPNNFRGIQQGNALATAVVWASEDKWPTPTRRDYKSGTGAQERLGHSPPLSDVIGGTLNPTWVEWLMGWPLGFTDLKPLATDKSPSAPQQLGDS